MSSHRLVYALAAVYVSMFAMVIATVLYINHVAAVNEGKWCHLLTTLDVSYRGQPPATPTGKRVAADIHQLLADLHCHGRS